MGAFTPRDVCNFDESPLALFGDQANRSLNYVNVDNEVGNPISSKVSMQNWSWVFNENPRDRNHREAIVDFYETTLSCFSASPL